MTIESVIAALVLGFPVYAIGYLLDPFDPRGTHCD